MKALVQDTYGDADVLRLDDADVPPMGTHDVLVRVHAAGVDPGVWHLMSGRPYLVRAMGFGLRAPKVRVRGRDLAGVVEAVGTGVTRFAPGDEVYGTCESGSFAELAVSRESRLARKPRSLTFEQAATVPISGVTALNGGTTPKELHVTATTGNGSVVEFDAVLRIDTPGEADYYRNDGILQYVLRSLVSSVPAAGAAG